MARQSPSRLAQVRARLDLPTVRFASGLLDGRHRSLFSGPGQDFEEMSDYQPGDDVSVIDWKASAAAGNPIIRRFVRESNLAMVLAVDTGRGMSATAPSGEEKSDVALFAAELMCYLARGRGDLVALVAGDSETLVQLPPRGGSSHMELLLTRLENMMTLEAAPSDAGRVLDRTLTWFNRRSLIVLITDETRPRPEHELTLKRLRTRHEMMVIQVADALPTTDDELNIDDVDTHLDLPRFVRARPGLKREAERYAEQRRTQVRDMLRHRGIESVRATGVDDLIDQLIVTLGRQKRVNR